MEELRFCSNCKCFRSVALFSGRQVPYATCLTCRSRQSTVNRPVNTELATSFDEMIEWIPSRTDGICQSCRSIRKYTN